MYSLEHDTVMVRILKFHIENDKEYGFILYMLMGWALGMCGLSSLVQIILIFYFFLFFESVSLYIVVISRVQIFCPIFPAPLYTPLIKTCYVFSNVYIHSPSFIKNNF